MTNTVLPNLRGEIVFLNDLKIGFCIVYVKFFRNAYIVL